MIWVSPGWFFKLEDGSQLPLASAEDIILQKLDWYRKGEQTSERQIRDVLGVLQVQGKDLDFVYMEDMAVQSGLSELLKKHWIFAGNLDLIIVELRAKS